MFFMGAVGEIEAEHINASLQQLAYLFLAGRGWA
jgi:hypothetical protein